MSSENNNNGKIDKINTIDDLIKVIQTDGKIEHPEIKFIPNLLFCFIFIALLSKLIFSHINVSDPHGSNGIATINLMCYSMIIFSLVILIFTTTILKNGLSNTNNINKNPILNAISIETFVIVIYLFWIISINIKYYKHINLRRVPNNFFLYSNLSHVVIIFQILFTGVNYMVILSNIGLDKDLGRKMHTINVLLVFLNFILILIQQIILENFTVDVA